MGTPGFSVRLDSTGQVDCVHVAGEVDLVTAEQLRDSIVSALAAHRRPRLVIDLGEVTFCDSAGLSVLVNAQRFCQELSVALILRRPDDRLRRTLKFAGLSEHFTIEP